MFLVGAAGYLIALARHELKVDVALALAVPTVAMIHGGEDGVDGKVTVAPADGPDGEYATVENGELRVDFEP